MDKQYKYVVKVIYLTEIPTSTIFLIYDQTDLKTNDNQELEPNHILADRKGVSDLSEWFNNKGVKSGEWMVTEPEFMSRDEAQELIDKASSGS